MNLSHTEADHVRTQPCRLPCCPSLTVGVSGPVIKNRIYGKKLWVQQCGIE